MKSQLLPTRRRMAAPLSPKPPSSPNKQKAASLTDDAAAQQSKNSQLMDGIQKARATVTLNATRSLGDIKRDRCAELVGDHRAAVQSALDKLSWSEWATGSYALSDLHVLLGLEIALADLTQEGQKPRYDELVKVIETLEGLLGDKGIFGPYRRVIEDTLTELNATRERFRSSHVNVDDMDHTALTTLIDVLKKCVLSSVESLVERVDVDQREAEEAHRKIIDEYLEEFRRESMIVESATPARLRASKPVEDLDPWQEGESSTGGHKGGIDSPVLKRYLEREKESQVVQEYDEEWYETHRREVSTLKPRAERVAYESGEPYFARCADSVQRIRGMCDERLRLIEARELDNKADADAIVGGIRKERNALMNAGEAFQAKKKAQREASERDLAKVQDFRQQQLHGSEELTLQYEAAKTEAIQWLQANEADVAEHMRQIVALQERVVQLVQARRAVAEAAVAALEAEEKRLSRQRTFVALCDTYESMLRVSMEDFLLPQGYSNVLVSFAGKCEELSRDGFDMQAASLARLRETALARLEASAISQDGLHRPLVARKRLKVSDLTQKSTVSRLQREFCRDTKDPYQGRHENTEKEILEMSRRIEAEIEPLEVHANLGRLAMLSALDRMRHDGFEAIATTDAVDGHWTRQLQDEHARFIQRGSRVPIVSLCTVSWCPSGGPRTLQLPTVVEPPSWFDPWVVDRALHAQRAERVFK